MKFSGRRRFLAVCFFCYCAVMLWLLFVRWRNVEITDYWAQIAGRVNLIPFSSTGSMLATLRENPRLDVLWVVIYNLGGNIVMFVPLGFCLPGLWNRFRKLSRSLLAVAAIMTCVELAQLFTLRGYCEIDDVMLNILGGAIGYGVWYVMDRKKR